ncbi:plant UBX domain-containing protein 4-like [Mercurialis annua]|uniref:plant UBX domain-containing protein 4-like n=1 Tax=Mercurialis annua TaxID=3986 RepID=UPI002160D63E|nr:plant UBX domain-containing protein 4-like [Mercurialis annua]
MESTTEAEANSAALINSFTEITSSSKEEALFYLESHQWNLDAAVSTFFDSNSNTITNINAVDVDDAVPLPLAAAATNSSSSSQQSDSPNYNPSLSPSRSRSRSPSPAPPSRVPYRLRSRGKKPAKSGGGGSKVSGGIRTLADLNRAPDLGSGSDDDDEDGDYQPEQYYTGGEKSGMVVQDPNKKPYDADAIFVQAKTSGVERPIESSSTSRSFAGVGRLLSGETAPSAAPQPPEAVLHNVTLWRNGFTIDDGPLRRFDDPANASFLESIKKSECPSELQPADRRSQVHLDLMRREENYLEPKKRQTSFQGTGRTLGNNSDTATGSTSPAASLMAAPLPSVGLVVDSSQPTTSVQLRLADGTRMVSRFNLHHTIRDIRGFIDASRPGGEGNYQLQVMGFPPKQLTDSEQTIEAAGIANSVVIQKF